LDNSPVIGKNTYIHVSAYILLSYVCIYKNSICFSSSLSKHHHFDLYLGVMLSSQLEVGSFDEAFPFQPDEIAVVGQEEVEIDEGK
jgi:hypothetical protein